MVFNCRFHKGEKYLNVSFVKAPIADGFVNSVMTWYIKTCSPFRKFIARFMYSLPSRHRQFVVKNAAVCKSLRLVKIENMG